MAGTATPLHIFENTAKQWVDTAAWPASAAASTYYLGASGTLHTGQFASGGTNPLTQDAVLDGPSDLTMYASSTATEVELTATLNVLSPNGTVVKQADGVFLGSQRKLDQAQSWYGQGSVLLQPAHPFTQASQPPANFHAPLAPTPQELANLAKGTYTIDSGAATASVLDLPLASPGQFTASPVNWGPSS
jgi:uncharacterized protein